MEPGGSRTARRGAGFFFTALGAVLASALTCCFVGALVAKVKYGRTMEVLERELGTWDELRARYPARPTNASALRVEELSAALAIDIAPWTWSKSRSPRESIPAIVDYLNRELGRDDPGFGPPPADLVTCLAEHAAALAALRQELLEGEPPRWKSDIDLLVETPLPNLVGHMALQRLIVTSALVRAAQGDGAGALADLEASFMLNTALRDDPILITQLVALSVARLELGLLRRLEHVPAVWRERLDEHDFRQSVLAALRRETMGWMRMSDPRVFRDVVSTARRQPGVWSLLLPQWFSPYVSFCVADLSGDWGRCLERLAALDFICDRDLAAAGASLDVRAPRWNVIARYVVSDPTDAVHRVGRWELDRELSARLLELAAARDAAGGTWPAELPDSPASTACPRDHWIYNVSPEGAMSIALDRTIEWSGPQRSLALPTRYSSVRVAVAGGDG